MAHQAVTVILSPAAALALDNLAVRIGRTPDDKSRVEIAWVALHAALLKPDLITEALVSLDKYAKAEDFGSVLEVMIGGEK